MEKFGYDGNVDEPAWPKTMLEQADLREDLETLQRWTAENPHVAAGVWFDNGPGGTGPVRLGVGVVGDIEPAAAHLRQLLAHPDLLDVVPKSVTEFDLRALQELIADERMRSGAHPTCRVTRIGIDGDFEKVSIGIDPFAQGFADELLAAYGSDRVIVEARGPVRPFAGGGRSTPPSDAPR